MKRIFLTLFLAFYNFMSVAGNYSLSGYLTDGTHIEFDSDGPYVCVRRKPGTQQEKVECRKLQCELFFPALREIYPQERSQELYDHLIDESRKNSYFSCSSSVNWPLSGTKYVFERHIGKNCTDEAQDDHDIYTCIKGCSSRVPKKLKKGGYCGPC